MHAKLILYRFAIGIALFTLGLAAVSGIVSTHPVAAAETTGEQAHDRGVLDGQIANIDYQHGAFDLQVGGRREHVFVLPSTNIVRRDNSYGTIGDLTNGARVSVYASESEGHLIAQLIRIR
ncbi:MAG: hypothetical protein JOZ38_09125 [Candidatus Eremiobacteraeota bacterium]|nr:hypothetical protein [Candidatus Eremiobacteraeota bacterium]